MPNTTKPHKKLVIAFDLDDVIVETAQDIIDHYNSRFGTKVTLQDYYDDDLTGVWGTEDRKMAVKRVNDYIETPEYYESLPIQQAISVITWLNRHHELHILTGRPDFTEEATKNWLAKHFPDIFKTVTFTYFYGEGAQKRSKGDICRQLGVDVLIDDHLGHALSAAEAGAKVLLFGDYPWNRSNNLPDSIRRVRNWHEVGQYFGVDDK